MVYGAQVGVVRNHGPVTTYGVMVIDRFVSRMSVNGIVRPCSCPASG